MKDFLLKGLAQLTGKTLEEAKGILAEVDALRAEVAALKGAAGQAPEALAVITAERDGFAGQVTALTTERDDLAGQVTGLTKERDQLAAQIKTVEDTVTAELARLGMDSSRLPGAEHESEGSGGEDATVKVAKALLAEYEAAKGSKAQDAVWAKAKAAGINLRTFATTGKVELEEEEEGALPG